MALARARGCAGRGSPPGRHAGQADASRRRNGPRKATSRRPITVRLRSKSCPAGGYRVPRTGRRAVVAKGREPLSRRMWGRRPGRPGGCHPPHAGSAQSGQAPTDWAQSDWKGLRIAVEGSEVRIQRQADHRERVELTIRSRGPAIRAEAAADDRYAALDLAFAKLESRLRRAADRRKVKDNVSVRSPGVLDHPAQADPAFTGYVPLTAPPPVNGSAVARPRTGHADDRDDFDRPEP